MAGGGIERIEPGLLVTDDLTLFVRQGAHRLLE